jgi:hypothetical protein
VQLHRLLHRDFAFVLNKMRTCAEVTPFFHGLLPWCPSWFKGVGFAFAFAVDFGFTSSQ